MTPEDDIGDSVSPPSPAPAELQSNFTADSPKRTSVPSRRRVRWPECITAAATVVMVLVTGVNVAIAISQWRVMEEANKQALTVARSQLRAYLLFDSGRVVKQKGERFKIILTVKNSGVTPAYNVRHWLDTQIYEFPPRNPLWKRAPLVGRVDENRSADIGQSSTYELDDPERRPITDLNDIMVTRVNALYIRARLEYRDVFQRLQCGYILAVSVPDDRPDRWKFRSHYHVVFEAANPTEATATCGEPPNF